MATLMQHSYTHLYLIKYKPKDSAQLIRKKGREKKKKLKQPAVG